MKIETIEKKDLPKLNFDLETQFTFKSKVFAFNIVGSHEFGMSNYFYDINILEEGKLIREAQIRSFTNKQFISNSGLYIFLPLKSHIEVFDLNDKTAIKIDYRKDLGIFSDYYLNQFNSDDTYLLLGFNNGFHLFNFENKTISLQEEMNPDKLVDIHIGENDLIWKNVFQSNSQKIYQIDFTGKTMNTIELIHPADFFDFNMDKYLKYTIEEKYNLYDQQSKGYRFSGILNKWYHKHGFKNIYSTLVPTGIEWNDEDRDLPCYEVIEKFVIIK